MPPEQVCGRLRRCLVVGKVGWRKGERDVGEGSDEAHLTQDHTFAVAHVLRAVPARTFPSFRT